LLDKLHQEYFTQLNKPQKILAGFFFVLVILSLGISLGTVSKILSVPLKNSSQEQPVSTSTLKAKQLQLLKQLSRKEQA